MQRRNDVANWVWRAGMVAMGTAPFVLLVVKADDMADLIESMRLAASGFLSAIGLVLACLAAQRYLYWERPQAWLRLGSPALIAILGLAWAVVVVIPLGRSLGSGYMSGLALALVWTVWTYERRRDEGLRTMAQSPEQDDNGGE
jgi:hypothetical protein